MKILKYPHPALRVTARPVAAIDAGVQKAAAGMIDLMYSHEGLGLAAPQVGLDVRLLVINFAGDPGQKDQEFVAINPVIVEQKGRLNDREGCLSFPGLYQNVIRAKSVKVQAYNLKGELYEMTCSELPARVWQHEVDHLNGVLFIDKMGPVGKLSSKKDLDRYVADFEKDKKKGDLPPDLEPKF
ncbi:MAG: peptide deformylase [Gemmataceae bacterium]|nr:peptide deformylase [Gemmataceae bacterium]